MCTRKSVTHSPQARETEILVNTRSHLKDVKAGDRKGPHQTRAAMIRVNWHGAWLTLRIDWLFELLPSILVTPTAGPL